MQKNGFSKSLLKLEIEILIAFWASTQFLLTLAHEIRLWEHQKIKLICENTSRKQTPISTLFEVKLMNTGNNK